jgi:hypothetical protein
MKKLLCTCITLAFSTALAASLEMYVAPLYYINEAENQQEAQNNYQKRLLDELNNVETDLELRFNPVAGFIGNPPQSLLDAITVSRTVQADYLLYGFIAEKDYTIQAEIRLLEYETHKVVTTFYAMDEKGQEERLLKNIAEKVYQFINNNFDIPLIEKPPQFAHLSIPVSIGYWTPVGSWFNYLIGTFTVNLGVRLQPYDPLFISRGFAYSVSAGLNVSYRMSVGKVYNAYTHGLTFSVPVLLHQKLDDENDIYYGLGFSYSLEFLNVKKPYEDPQMERYAAAGVLLQGGYRWRFGKNTYIFTESKIEMIFYDVPLINVSLLFGAEWRIYNREVRRKW